MNVVNTISISGDIQAQQSVISGDLTRSQQVLSGNLTDILITSARWGKIVGDIENQLDLINYLSIINCGTSTEVV